MATILATRAAISARPTTVRASAADKVRPPIARPRPRARRETRPSPAPCHLFAYPIFRLIGTAPGVVVVVVGGGGVASSPRARAPRPTPHPRSLRALPPFPPPPSSRQAASASPAALPRRVASGLSAAALSASLLLGAPGFARAEIRLPPIDPDPDRCERAYVGNTIGQANAVSDRVLDLRQCVYDGKDLTAKTLSGALMVDGSFKGTNMTETVLSKVYAPNANFAGADFTNAVVDRATFDGADLTNANFFNAVITGTTVEGATLTGATFENALIGKEDVKRLCENPTVEGETRFQVGCKD